MVAPQCYSGQAIFDLMNANGGNTESLQTAQTTAAEFREMHDEVAEELAKIQIMMGEAWVGEAAEAAKKPLTTFREMSATAGTNLEPSRTSFDDQSRVFTESKSKLVAVPDQPEDASMWGFLPGVDSQEDKNNQWNEKNENNYRVYGEYVKATDSNKSYIPQEYPKVDLSFSDPGSGGQPGDGTSRASATPTVGGAASGTGGSYGGNFNGPTSASATPQVNSPAASVGGSGQYTPGTNPSGYTPGGGYPGGTAPSGYGSGPGGFGPAAGGLGSAGYGVGGVGGSGRGGRGSAGGEYGAGGGAAFGPIGSGAAAGGAGAAGAAPGGAGGAAGGAGQGLGAGRAAGAGKTGGAGSSGMGGAAAAGGAGGAAGRGMGGGMMGAGAGRGQGGEDSEHQRKYIQDTDDWFKPERDEDGGILRDPVTGMPVVPPVIGE